MKASGCRMSWDVPSGMGLGSTVEERRFSAA